jgi:hypothetical protein
MVSNLSTASHYCPLRTTAFEWEFEHGSQDWGSAGYGSAMLALCRRASAASGEEDVCVVRLLMSD